MKVFLVDDHSVFRAGVKAEIGKAVDIVGEAGTVLDAITNIRNTTPDVVLLDVHMPDGGGVAVIQGVVNGSVATIPKFLALSVSDAAEDVISVIRSGARGYVTKSISGPELVDAIARVYDGDAVFTPDLRASFSTPLPGLMPEPASVWSTPPNETKRSNRGIPPLTTL